MPFTLANNVMVQARFGRGTLADVVINTFTFRHFPDLSGDALYGAIRARLDTFYNGTVVGQSSPVRQWLSPALVKLDYYMRPASALAGTPGIELPSLNFSPNANQGVLPAELAVACSYRGAGPPTPRTRGRVYLGPLTAAALATNGLIDLTMRDNVRAAAKGLAGESTANPVRWVVASRAGNISVEITNGYIDEHFDVQRRRDPGTQFYGRRPSTWTV